MRPTVLVFYVLTFVAPMVTTFCFPDNCLSDEPKDLPHLKSLEKIVSTDTDEQRRGKWELTVIRHRTVSFLISVLEDEKLKSLMVTNADGEEVLNDAGLSAVVTAMDLLGEYRAVEAVEPLVRNLSLMYFTALSGLSPSHLMGHEHTPDILPAVRALIKIGNAAVPVALKHIKSGEPKIEGTTENLSFVIARIEGKETAISLLERELSAETDEKARANLQKAIDYLRTTEVDQYHYNYELPSPPYQLWPEAQPQTREGSAKVAPPAVSEKPTVSHSWVMTASIVANVALAGLVVLLLFRRRKAA